jgi:hypothetical protein
MLEAKLAHETMAAAFKTLAKTIQTDDPSLEEMCHTAKQARKCMRMARERTAQLKEMESRESYDIDEAGILRGEIGALCVNAGAFCLEKCHQAIFNRSVNLVPDPFAEAVIKAAADPANVTVVAGAVTAVATVPSRLGDGALGVNITTVNFDFGAVGAVGSGASEACEPFGFVHFDPLADDASIYAGGPESAARYYANVREVTKSPGFILNAVRAMYKASSLRSAQTRALGADLMEERDEAFDSHAAVCRVWLEILADVETKASASACAASALVDVIDVIDIIPLFHDIEKKSVAPTVVQTAINPHLALLESVASRPSIQKGDLHHFAASYAGSVAKMTDGLEPGQYSYFVIEGRANDESMAPMAPPPKRARSGRESTAV